MLILTVCGLQAVLVHHPEAVLHQVRPIHLLRGDPGRTGQDPERSGPNEG